MEVHLERQPGVFENAAFSNRCGGSFLLDAFPVDASPIVTGTYYTAYYYVI